MLSTRVALGGPKPSTWQLAVQHAGLPVTVSTHAGADSDTASRTQTCRSECEIHSDGGAVW